MTVGTEKQLINKTGLLKLLSDDGKKKNKTKNKKKSLKGRLAPITMILINCEWKKKDIALYVKKNYIYPLLCKYAIPIRMSRLKMSGTERKCQEFLLTHFPHTTDEVRSSFLKPLKPIFLCKDLYLVLIFDF